MVSTRTTARIVGVLFIIGTVAGSLSAVLLTPILGASDVLLTAAERSDRALLGVLLILVMGFALALIPLVLFPILKVYSEPLALGYAVFRGGLETATYLVSALVWLILVGLGREYVDAPTPEASRLDAVGAVVLRVDDAVGHVLLPIVFPIGALMFYYVLYGSRLVPRWLAGWGIAAAFLWIAAGLFAIFGIVTPYSMVQIAMALPIAIQEMVLAVWLIVRGFDTARVASGAGETGITPQQV